MGKKIGIFTEVQVKSLKPEHRETLKKQAVKHLKAHPELHRIVSVKGQPKISKAAREKLLPTFNRLKKKSEAE